MGYTLYAHSVLWESGSIGALNLKWPRLAAVAHACRPCRTAARACMGSAEPWGAPGATAAGCSPGGCGCYACTDGMPMDCMRMWLQRCRASCKGAVHVAGAAECTAAPCRHSVRLGAPRPAAVKPGCGAMIRSTLYYQLCHILRQGPGRRYECCQCRSKRPHR